MLLQKLVGTAEMAVADKAEVRRQRRGVYGFQHQMLAGIDELFLALGMGTPEQKNQALLLLADHLDHLVGKGLPADLGMGASDAVFHCQRGVKQQYALLRPMLQVPVA